MGARCLHGSHDSRNASYRVGTSKDKETVQVSVPIGWNSIRRMWEVCDRGFLLSEDEKRKIRKRPHSKQRTTKSNREENE